MRTKADKIMQRAGVPVSDRLGVMIMASLMNEDPNGLYSNMRDYGWDVSFEDVQEIIKEAE